MDLHISFCAAGAVKQRIELAEGVSINAEDLQDGLNHGKYITTIQEGGTIEETLTGKLIGTVKDVTNECEYTEFVVE